MSSATFGSAKPTDRHIRLKSATYTSDNEPILNVYDSNWKDLIFLPFNRTWRFFITLSIIFNGAIIAYDIAYHSEKSNTYLFLFLETLYAIDVGLYISHRNMEQHRILREHEPRHMYRLLFDVLTLIPLSLMYTFIMTTSRRKSGYDLWPELLKAPSIYRFYRIQEYLNDLSYNAGVNQKVVICLGQATKLLIWMHLVGAQFYLMKCWKCAEKSWSQNLRDVKFDADDPKEWLGIILVFVGSLFAHNFRGYIRGEQYWERIIISCVMFTGFVLHFLIFFGNLISIFTKTFKWKHVFVDRLHSIQFVLKDWKVSNACARRTIEYYTVFWDRRMGLRKPPAVFRLLPLPLQKEVTLDVFWEALRHSHLFANEEMCVKRMISSNMKAEFFLPGDFVYRSNKVKSKMVYIASGILQILTAEDEESPILSLSAGTVLGEICCLRPMPSVANVRCATYCELHTLSSRDLYNALGDNSSKAKELLTSLQRRIEMADYLYHIKVKTIFMTTDEDTFERTEDTSIKWLKQQWRNLMEAHERSFKKKSSAKYVQDLTYLYQGPWHCSNFLNLLALSKEVELKMQSICLTGHCPFVMEPSSSFLLVWSYVNLTTVMAQSLIVPYQVCFNEKITPSAFMLCFGLDLVYFLDLYLKLSTAIKKSGVLIDKPGLILLERLKDFYFAIGLISTLPIDYFMHYHGRKYAAAVLKLNRLLKMNEVFRFVSGKEQNIWLDTGTTRLVKYMFIYTFTGYWFACYLYATSNFKAKDRLSVFVLSILYTLSGYFGVGIISTFEYSLFRMINYYCLIMTGYYVFSFCFCEISATSVLRLGKRRRYQEFLKATSNYMRKNRIFGALRQKITSILHFNWYYNENEKLENIFEDATDELWDEVVYRRIENCFKMVPLFHGFEEQVVVKTAKAAKLKTLPPEVVVTVPNATSNWMYVILRGYCELTSIMAGDRERKTVTVLKANDAFSVIEMLHQVPSLVSVKTVTSVELVYVSYDDFHDIVYSSAEAKKTLTATIDWHIEKYDAALNRRRCRLPPMIPSEKSYGQGEMFTYEVYDYLCEDAEKTAYLAPFSKLGNWSFLRLFLMKRTINPNNKYFKVYECFHCCVCAFRVSMGLTFTNLLIEYRPYTDYALRVMEVLFLTNIYIRMHLRYYNEDGILVTHPWFTCNNYLSGAFLVDALTILPFRKIKFDRILGYRRRDVVYNILLLTVRPLLLYRPLQGLSYLQSNINSSYGVIQFLRYTMIVLMTMTVLTTVLQRYTCVVSAVGKPPGPLMVKCPNSTWMVNSPFGMTMRPQNLYTRCFYVVTMLFTAATCGLFDPIEDNVLDVLVFIALFTVLALLKLIVWADITSHRITGNVNLTIFQERVKSFLKFLERESIDDDLVKSTVDHYEYIWKKTQGTNTQNIFQDFHPQLHQDISYFLYSSTLNNVQFFQGASEGFYRNFGMHLKEAHHRKDSVIIRCNDVQGMMYLVYKGSVDVKVASMRICTLGRGGVFGCFERQGLTRQTIQATARVHASLLTINSNHFHKLISKYPAILKKVEETTFLSSEFVKGHSAIRETKDEDNVSSVGEMSSSVNVSSTAKFRFISIFTKLHFVIYHEKPWYLLWEYAVCVHVAPLSSWAVMFLITMPLPPFIAIRALLIGYSIEVLFYIKMFISFHVTYLEPESGVLIKDHSLIWRRYARTLSGFGVDLISCFPFELIVLIFTRDRSALKWAKINRVLRFFYLVKYYKEREAGANVKTHLRWTYLLYWIVFSIQIMTSIWWFAAEDNNQVHYLNSTKQTDKFNYVKADPGFESVVLSYYYIVNIFTSTGMRDVAPITPCQLLVTIIMMMWVQFILIGLTSGFATVLSIAHYTMNHYEYSIEQVRTYWQRLDLSPPIVNNMWRYFLQLWQRQRGEWMPHLLTEAPPYLKQDLMFSLYGGHLTKHFLFCDTHVDFLRQLVVHLQRCLFFPGNHLVEKGDVDGSMYFIHKGEVDVYETNGSNTFLVMTVHKGDSFGELQGLHRVPHDFSYKARTVVDAIILRHDDWQYLLQWFPASNERIQKRARDHRLVLNADDALSRTSNRTDEDEDEVVFGAAAVESRESVRVIHKFV